MRIIHVAAEMAPIAKVGGLGDVLLGLPLDLKRRGHDVVVIVPRHRSIPRKGALCRTFTLPLDGKKCKISLFKTRVHGVEVWMLEDHTRHKWLARADVYGYKDDAERFALFSKAALVAIETDKKQTDIVHLHDWHTAALAHFAKNRPERFILTLHNLQYQGIIETSFIKKLGEKPLAKAQSKNTTNLLKLGILSADFITTVSPTFAKETLSGKMRWGIDKVLKSKQRRFMGILNGIDYTVWNPSTDPYIRAHLNLPKMIKAAASLFKRLFNYKQQNKRDLQKSLHLERSDKPIIACITRLVEQKGLGLIQHAIEHTKKRGGQFVLLGSGASEETRNSFKELEKKLGAPLDIHMQFNHDERLVHKIFAGSDMFIIPSLFEPCGLTQMIAMRFGTIPIARKTGGLADTVRDVDYHNLRPSTANGFVFERPTKLSIERAIDRALGYWEKQPTEWQKLVSDALACRFDWEHSGAKYLELYEEMLTA